VEVAKICVVIALVCQIVVEIGLVGCVEMEMIFLLLKTPLQLYQQQIFVVASLLDVFPGG
jgi:hypothetical protein